MSNDRMQIQPDALAAAAASSTATEAARSPVTIPSPPPAAAGSPVDASAVGVAASIQGLLAARDAADITAVSKQTAALNESPPELVHQDQTNADNMTAAGERFTMPTVMPPGGKVWTV